MNSAIAKDLEAKRDVEQNNIVKRNAENWVGIFEDTPEIECELSVKEGALPEGLVGSFYRNGPGKRQFSGSFFDGDGLIRALHIGADKSIKFKSRFVHTNKYLKEKDSPKKRVRTAGTNLPGGLWKNMFRIPGDEANTNVYHFDGKLLASEEGGHPWIMDPQTLNTEGEEHFNKQLPRKVAFSAHAHYDAQTKEIYNFGMVPGKNFAYQCYKIDQNNKLTMLAKFPCFQGSFAHDYALTSKWMVFIVGPLAGNMPKFLFGMESFFDTLKWHPDWNTEIFLVPRDGGKALRLETDTFALGHVVSAWDQGEDIVVDAATVPDMNILSAAKNYKSDDWSGFGSGVISRIVINPKTGTVKKETLSDIPSEFPRIHPKMECKQSKWAYLASNTKAGEGGIFKATTKLNRETGETDIFDFGDNKVSLEPVFAPDPNGKEEDDGWIIDYVYDQTTKLTDVVIFNAKSLSDGPICTIGLPINAGTTFHGTWVPARN